MATCNVLINIAHGEGIEPPISKVIEIYDVYLINIQANTVEAKNLH